MYVTLNVSNQFGTDGPQIGAKGRIIALMQEDSRDNDFYALTYFDGFDGYFWVTLKSFMWPDTSNAQTVYYSYRKEDL